MEERGRYPASAAVLRLICQIKDSLPNTPSPSDVEDAIGKMEVIHKEELSNLEANDNEIKDPDVPEFLFNISKELNKELIMHKANIKRIEPKKILDEDRIQKSYENLTLIALQYCSTTSSSSAGSSSSAAPTGDTTLALCEYHTTADATLALQAYVDHTEDLRVPEEHAYEYPTTMTGADTTLEPQAYDYLTGDQMLERFLVPEEVFTSFDLPEELSTTLRRMTQNDHFWPEARGERSVLQRLFNSSITTITLIADRNTNSTRCSSSYVSMSPGGSSSESPIVHAVPIQSVRPSHSSSESPIVRAVPIQSVRPSRRSSREPHNLFMENYEGMDDSEETPNPSKRKRSKKGPAGGGPAGGGPAGGGPAGGGPAGRLEGSSGEEMEERGPYSAEYQSELEYEIDKINKPSAQEVSYANARIMEVDKEEADELGAIENQTRNPDVPEELFNALRETWRNLVKHKARKERCTLQTTLDHHGIYISYDNVIRWSTSSSAAAGAPSVRMYPGSSSSAAPTAPASSRDATSTGA